jgi:hypothetical protein
VRYLSVISCQLRQDPDTRSDESVAEKPEQAPCRFGVDRLAAGDGAREFHSVTTQSLIATPLPLPLPPPLERRRISISQETNRSIWLHTATRIVANDKKELRRLISGMAANLRLGQVVTVCCLPVVVG